MFRVPRKEEQYSTATGIIFLFNLIVGTGALAVPSAFQSSGLLLGSLLLVCVSFVSFITVTFLIECLSIANAVSKRRREGGLLEDTPLVSESENIFDITEKFEVGQMANLMAPKWCQVIAYFSLCIYLFGDLSIYILVAGKTMSYVICHEKFNFTDNDKCWSNHEITRINVYRVSVICFVFLMGPFIFLNLQKTKALQIFTICLRWVAFFIMTSWSAYKVYKNGNQGHPKIADFVTLPNLFGALVYAFMCQHSIPGLLLPIKQKKYLLRIIASDYLLVGNFYFLLTLSAVFAFPQIKEIYTLSFWGEVNQKNPNKFLLVLVYFLALFPIFTLSTSFPIIGITLRNNLRTLVLGNKPFRWYYDKLLFPLSVIVPPAILTLAITDLQLLVGVVGSYAGTAVQYLIPCLLVTYARKEAEVIQETNIYGSPFKHKFWVIAVYVWMAVCLILITLNYAFKFLRK